MGPKSRGSDLVGSNGQGDGSRRLLSALHFTASCENSLVRELGIACSVERPEAALPAANNR